ncbi:class II fructose-bisphosphate aldolase [Metamycoplasma spumans]|uniref:class II fructose-bisphosphate aldolase n=1 Tax=Metamycoplasma spumans TaxID=92406 RepID=UPI0034DD8311
MELINGRKIVYDAYKNKDVIFHINLNNLEWSKAIISVAKSLNKPVIIGATPAAIKYCGGFNTVFNMIKGLIIDYQANDLVILHLDHGKFEDCIKAIEVGFKSVMYDGSEEDFETNLKNTIKICEIAKLNNCSVEAEVGKIGKSKNSEFYYGELTKIDEAIKLKNAGVDILAVGIGNIHGEYPENWKGLDFDLLRNLNVNLNMPLVLHGGSGISKEDLKKSISLGISKININTELQIINAMALKEYFSNNEIMQNKNYNPRKLYANSNKAMEDYIKSILLGDWNEN